MLSVLLRFQNQKQSEKCKESKRRVKVDLSTFASVVANLAQTFLVIWTLVFVSSLSPVAKTITCLIIRALRRVCTCHLISSSSVRDPSDGAQSLRLPTDPSGTRWRALPRGRGHASGRQKEASRWSDTRRGGLRTLFFANLPQHAFTACDVVEVDLHRGAFEPLLSDEDQEIDPDRWCSHSAWGQECWQVVAQWVWNLRLEVGHQLHPDPVRTTEFAPALPPASPHTAPASGSAPPHVGLPWKAGRFSGQDFTLQPDGTLRCPADQKLIPHEQRREANGSLRVVHGASIRSCRPCPLREQGQWRGSETSKPRQVSVLLHPLVVGSLPILWKDWSRRQHRRICMQLLRHQHVEGRIEQGLSTAPTLPPAPLSRAQRAHDRLAFQERLARNAQVSLAGQVTIRLCGVPEDFATSLGKAPASPASSLFSEISAQWMSYVGTGLHRQE